jgi:TolB-like protein
MLRPDGYVKVLDFGLAKLSERSYETRSEAGFSAVETNPGTIMGTYTYMSPEQARGYEVDERTDIFSLGVVLYEMLTGREPFIGPTSSDVIAALLNDEPLPLERFGRTMPDGLQRIVDRALAKDRSARYRQMNEMIADLRDLKQQLEMKARSGSRRRAFFGARFDRPTPAIISRLGPLLALVALPVVFYLAFYFTRLWRGPAPVEPIRSIAVLPFRPLVAGQGDEVLEMGMADTLITRLSSLRQVNVPPLNAVRRYGALDQDALAAGRELKVEAVLEGSIQRAEGKIRVTMRLIRVEDGALLWTRQFDERWTDIFAVQDAVSQRLAADLLPTLTGEERTDLARRYTTNPEAYELFMTGRYHWNKRSREGIRKSLESFSKAIEKDPQYALAYVGLADAYGTLGSYRIQAPSEAMTLAEAAAAKALSIDPGLAEAHATMGKILAEYRWDWRRIQTGDRTQTQVRQLASLVFDAAGASGALR